MNRNLKKGGGVAILTVLVIAAVIVINLIIGTLPAKYRRLDLSTSHIFSLSDTTVQLLDGLTTDVDIYIVGDPGQIDERITHFAGLYADRSGHVNVEVKDPVLHPDVLSTLDTEANTVLVSCPDTGKKQSIPFSDIIQIDLMAYYQYHQYRENAFDGEGQLTSAISNVTNGTRTTVYRLSGHGESSLPDQAADLLKKSGMEVTELNLLTDGSIPADCDLLLINNPQTDLSVDEKSQISGYLKQGGNVLILAGYTQSGCPNLTSLCAEYGIEFLNGYVADSAPGHYYGNNPFYIIPEYDFSGGMLSGISDSNGALLLNPAGLAVSGELPGGVTVAPFLTTSESGVMVDPETQAQTQGAYVLGATATADALSPETASSATPSEAADTPQTTLTVIAAPALIDGGLLSQFPSLTNLTIFMNAVSHNQPQAVNLAIPAKSLEITYNMITTGGLWSALFIIVIPVIFLIAGFVIWMKRRKL